MDSGGHAVQQAASKRFISSNLELGGKDPAYVRADAPLEATIENLVDGAYFNAGQSCCAVERIYVHRDVYRQFVDGFVELTRQYRLGNPLDPNIVIQSLLQHTIMISDMPPSPVTGGIILKSTTGAMIVVNDSGIYISNGKGAMITLIGTAIDFNVGALTIVK